MKATQDVLELVVGERLCLIVGAAPIAGAPITPPSDCVVMAVNGGISSVSRCDVWVVNARTAEDIKNHRLYPTMVKQGANRDVGLLVLLSKDEDDSDLQTLKRLKHQHTRWGFSLAINNSDRRRIECLGGARLQSEVQGNVGRGPMTKHALSAGLAAVCMAFWGGASNVLMDGFSWSPGYGYPTPYPVHSRGHIAGDKLGLARLKVHYGDRLIYDLPLSQEQLDMARLDPHTRRMNRRTRLNQIVPPYTGPLPRRVIATPPASEGIVFYAELGAERERRFREGEVITLRDPKHFKPSHMRDVWTPPDMAAAPPRRLSPVERGEALADQMSGRGRKRGRPRGPARLKKDAEQNETLVGAPSDVL